MNRTILIIALLLLLMPTALVSGKVTFDSSGTTLIDGVPFFPIGIYLYHFNTEVLAEVHEQGFNTVIWGCTPDNLDTLKEHGLMTLQYSTDEWLAKKDHPSILAWYLTDEPEGYGWTPEKLRAEYERVKKIDPTRPIGVCHYLWEALTRFKDSSEFVISDVYPVLAERNQRLIPLTDHLEQIHKIHGPGFPAWPVIQIFGGPDTDGGKWAQPTPLEVRCMTYMALTRNAKAMLFFSYWPKVPRTWNAMGVLTRELHRLSPFFVLPSKELPVTSSEKWVYTRGIQIGKSGLVIAVNVDPVFRDVKLKVPGLKEKSLELPFENRKVSVKNGEITERFMPYEVHVYQWGETPQIPIKVVK